MYKHFYIPILSIYLLLSSYSIVFSRGTQTPVSSAAPSSSLHSVTLLLDWTPNTNHVGAYVAKHKGYFKEVGLEVHIAIASESGVEALVGSGKAEFGFSYQESTTMARASSTPIPIVALAAVLPHNTSGFAAPTHKNITSPSDFKHKKYGSFGSPIEMAMLDTLMEPYGGGSDTVVFIQAGAMDFFQATHTNTFDFAWVFEGWTMIEASLKNIDMYYLPLRELNEVFDYYTPIIISSELFIEENPDITTSFMHGLARGYQWAIDNPYKAADILLQYGAPELNQTLVHKSMEFLVPKFIDDAPYWGAMEHKVWERYTQWLQDNNFISKDFSLEGIYTNDFLPQ